MLELDIDRMLDSFHTTKFFWNMESAMDLNDKKILFPHYYVLLKLGKIITILGMVLMRFHTTKFFWNTKLSWMKGRAIIMFPHY